MVATEVLLLVQVPPVPESVSVVVVPVQVVCEPEMGDIVVVTVNNA
jgi:hypothetical protein